MYKIFINDKPFILLQENEQVEARYKHCKQVTYDPLKTATYVRDCEQKKHEGYVLVTDDVEFAFIDLCTHFVWIEAAGGVVFNANNDVLLIKRLGKWDLPKGKMEGDESQEQSALREVEEECGIGALTVEQPLPNTYHVYKQKNFFYIKTTYWYKMRVAGVPVLTPQREEQITEARWMPWEQVNPDTLDTYISIAELLREVPV